MSLAYKLVLLPLLRQLRFKLVLFLLLKSAPVAELAPATSTDALARRLLLLHLYLHKLLKIAVPVAPTVEACRLPLLLLLALIPLTKLFNTATKATMAWLKRVG